MVPQSLQLLNIPLDILWKILDNLLPPLSAKHESQSLLALCTTPDPLDVFQVMRTCRALHDFALPWLYRRVHYCKKDSASGRWKYLCDHPEAGIHVRLFVVNFLGHDQSLTEGFKFLQPSMKFMDSLQVLVIGGATELGHDTLQPVEELLRKPRLEALVTSLRLAAFNASCPRSLRHLSCEDHDLRRWVLEAIPQVESLAIFSRSGPGLANNKLQTLPISWDRLRRLDIVMAWDWCSLLDNFAAWKRASDTPSPLVEVSIHYSIIQPVDLLRILEALSGQNIHTLSLVYVWPISEAFLEQLVQAFPQLKLLRLCSHRHCCAWEAGLSATAKALGRLKMLTELQWNYIDRPYMTIHSHQDPHPLHELSVIAEHSHSLKRVQFHQVRNLFSFTRSGDGVFEAEEGSPFQYSAGWFPDSSWRCSVYDRP